MNKAKPFAEDLYPELSAEEQAKAQENLKKYVEVVRRIYEESPNKKYPT